ncbi:5-bromo-4-chloroindolyl phosphate hydrolysis family protein [Oceanobacillus sp. Castelsardo]|uniref:5-bromo-4-chloroindolyl phosphate hydrolysis family protein n=1 Tax=Oceanobacillus sp. Castelsardo TaxID=1851204 RepID=UPI000837B577|nr:5-bromo-4-chloroindolyl phosphate hydrolysis family protein [Oceanobacillus sp. Castelsardo]
MRTFVLFIIQSISSFAMMIGIWLLSFLALEQTFLLSTVYAFISGGLTFLTVKGVSNRRFVKKNGLTRREYKYIERNLKEAKDKISRLQRALMNVRSIQHAKRNIEMIRTVRKIYSNTKKEPKRFYKAEGFFYERLDSLVELAEKYSFLSSQPAKSREMTISLRETESTLTSLNDSVKKDLYIMLNDDVDTLHFELDVAKNSINRMKKNNRGIY